MNKSILFLATLLLIMSLACSEQQVNKPQILVTLADAYHTPDGCTLSEDGDIILSVPNFNNDALVQQGMINAPYPPCMLKINQGNEVEEWYQFKPGDYHPATGHLGPMGCDFGPDGHLYVADNQLNFNPNHVSRLLRINVKNGKAISCDVVVEGFVVPNAVIWRGNTVYVSETMLVTPTEEGAMGAIYAIDMAEWENGPVQLIPYTEEAQDPHLIAKFNTSGRVGFSADGLTFDGAGNLYCGIFEDGLIYRTTFDNDQVISTSLFAQDEQMACCDGIFWNSKDNTIYVADMLNNAVQAVDMQGHVETVWENDDTDGADGLLDQPCEVIVRGDELIIVNMDMYFESEYLKNTRIDKPFTLSVIGL
jgi:sugar lactone lactonase YvrE